MKIIFAALVSSLTLLTSFRADSQNNSSTTIVVEVTPPPAELIDDNTVKTISAIHRVSRHDSAAPVDEVAPLVVDHTNQPFGMPTYTVSDPIPYVDEHARLASIYAANIKSAEDDNLRTQLSAQQQQESLASLNRVLHETTVHGPMYDPTGEQSMAAAAAIERSVQEGIAERERTEATRQAQLAANSLDSTFPGTDSPAAPPDPSSLAATLCVGGLVH
jgi:hypothetical protein